MTRTSIVAIDKKQVNQIERGTLLKKSGDMFIVAKISEAQFTSAVDDALFSPRYSHSHIGGGHSPRFEQNTEARRNPAESKYVLISLTTGLKFYQEFLTLTELLMRVTKAGFQIVESVEIKEV
jgi:hypothetical protein